MAGRVGVGLALLANIVLGINAEVQTNRPTYDTDRLVYIITTAVMGVWFVAGVLSKGRALGVSASFVPAVLLCAAIVAMTSWRIDNEPDNTVLIGQLVANVLVVVLWAGITYAVSR